MPFEKKLTPAQWKERLITENTPITLEEYHAGAIIRLMGQMIEATQALSHLEGMLGAIDEAFSRHDANYAGSSKIREALHQQRLALTTALRTNGQVHDPT